MPSLRKRVSSYFRQLSFHNEPRDKRHNVNENSFVTKYLQGHIAPREGPAIIHGKNPTDLPNYELAPYETGPESLMGCYSGPNGGLTTVRRAEKHLSVQDADIDFIDTQEQERAEPRRSPQRARAHPVDNTTMIIRVAGQEYCVTNRTKRHSKSHSLGSISDFDVEIETTRIDREFYNSAAGGAAPPGAPEPPSGPAEGADAAPERADDCDSKKDDISNGASNSNDRRSYSLAKSKSEGNPFRHNKRGKIIRVAQRPGPGAGGGEADGAAPVSDDSALPPEWNRKSDVTFGLSDSLYDRNQVTGSKNGDPIADCFGVISRGDSAVLAVADGVNWGEKASVAAKSAVHGCLHYLNKTVFNDTKPFEKLTVRADETAEGGGAEPPLNPHRVANTRDIFVCLLRAFNCAHDLILENKGMLTTLTVAVVLPLKPRARRDEGEAGAAKPPPQQYVCCVCNVGDTLAYVYSQRHGLRELTKGSHDINCNRDMRDALGALGPVDGINPELSNLTLSVTTLQRGDIVMVASDGLTDNFDPNVCRFTVNTHAPDAPRPRKPSTSRPSKPAAAAGKPPAKPPRRSQTRGTKPAESDKGAKDKEADAAKPAEQPRKTPAVAETKSSSLRRQASGRARAPDRGAPPPAPGYKFLRSKTAIEMRPSAAPRQILRNEDGIPYVTPVQRYELQLLLIEDILKNGISGREAPCTTARKLCESLVSFTFSITSAKRRTLEDQELYFDNRNGLMVEVSQQEKKLRRKRGLERVQNLPGKLDHVTVVAWNVGNSA